MAARVVAARPHLPASDEAGRLVRAQARVVARRMRLWERQPGDAEALHDVRTSLRRLRVIVRSFRRDLGDLARRGIRRRLRDAFHATSTLRDLDVFAAWVSTLPPSPAQRHLLAAVAADTAASRSAVLHQCLGHSRAARRRMRATAPRKAPARPRLFGTAAAQAIRAELQAVAQGLATFDPIRAPDGVHATRIAAKRVRYLVDALAGRSPDARRIVAWCRTLQDLAGEWRDGQLASDRVRACPALAGRNDVLRHHADRRRRARLELRRFVADGGAWRIARRDGLAIAGRYALAARSGRSDRSRR